MNRSFLLALASLSAAALVQAQPCVSGSTLAQLSTCPANSLTVTNSVNSWTLSGFTPENVVSAGFGLADGTSAGNLVTVNWAPYTVGNLFGFAVTFSAAGATNLFSASSATGGPRLAAFQAAFNATANQAAANITQYGVFISGWSPADNTIGDVGPSARVLASISANNALFSRLEVDQTLTFRNPVTGPNQTTLNALTSYQIASGENGASAALTSYTVYFLPAATPPTVQITIQTNINGPEVSVDGGLPFTGAQTFTFAIGSTHTIGAASPQPAATPGTRWVFQNWSDNGAISHQITADSNRTITANFGTQHRVITSVAPVNGGTITPASGTFFDAGSTVAVSATPNPGFLFAGFTGALGGFVTPQNLVVNAPAEIVANFLAPPDGSFRVRYVSHLDLGDSVINLSNTGANGAGLAAGTTAATTGAICANVYAFSPDEQMVACCSCPVTPNGLVSLSARQDLVSNTLTPAVPTSMVVKLVATTPIEGSCLNSAAGVAPARLAPGLAAWGTTLKPGIAGARPDTVETEFRAATLSAGELNRLQQLCNFIVANGSGFGICRSCRLGGLGGARN